MADDVLQTSIINSFPTAVIDPDVETISLTTPVTLADVDTTVMNVTSSNGGVFRKLLIGLNTTLNQTVTLTSIKYTRDGASEQTLDFDNINIQQMSSTSSGTGGWCLDIAPIKYNSSFTLKVNLNSLAGYPKACCLYTENI